MLRALTGVLKYVVGTQQDFLESSVDSVNPWPDEPHAQTDKTKVCPSSQQNVRNFTGSVTQMCHGYGLIDGSVYFAVDAVVGGIELRQGDNVRVTASRQHSDAGWRAERVDLVDDEKWHPNRRREELKRDSDGSRDYLPLQSIVGTVTKLSRYGDGIINGDAAVFNRDVLVKGYVPCLGDWVRAEVQCVSSVDVEQEWTSTKVQPLRVRTFEGRIRALFGAYGFIDEDIYFSSKVCGSQWQPKAGDLVRVTAIECSHRQTNWRAIRVEPSGGRVVNPRAGCRRPRMTLEVTGDDDSNGISVTGSSDAGQIFVGQTTSITVLVRNENIDRKVTLHSCNTQKDCWSVLVFSPCCIDQLASQVADGYSGGEVEGCGTVAQLPLDLLPRHQCAVELTIFGSDLGYLEHQMQFDFSDFIVTRILSVTVCDPLQLTIAASTRYQRSSHYRHYQHSCDSDFSDCQSRCVPGRRPPRQRTLTLPNKLQQYPVPERVQACLVNRENILTVCPSIGKPLTMASYSLRFASLLHIEEVQMKINIRQFDIAEASMRRHGPFLQLPVPGLAEGRPSLLVGDKVIASVPGASSDEPCYEGYIHEVHGEDILLKFSEDFHKNFQNEDYDVQFTFNRTPLRRCQQAVEFAKNVGERVLFPGEISPRHPVASVQLNVCSRSGISTSCGFFNCLLNERQREAVQRIVAGQGRPAPYILFGPPGTGKTVTMVEGILQVLHRVPSSRVLACAPSNSAADLIAERLHLSGAVQQGDMARLNAYQREKPPPDNVLPYCHTADDLPVVSRYRVVVCTCTTSGILYSLGVSAGHFSHVFVDEAGQATEPECLISVNFAAGSDSQVILTGDPFQLGAVLQSRIAETHGLGISLLERLISRPCYQRDESQYAACGSYNPFSVTKLTNNYRSHPALLSLSSETFYHGELVPCADQRITHLLCNWQHLPNRNDFPLLFHGMRGEDVREGNSPSWFNPVEAVQVVKYVQALLGGSCQVQPHHIGVITPYRKQVEKIRLLLNTFGVDGIKVGSVEEFQGQERRVVILSTVRSTASQVGSDVRHCLGFLSNPKRFNVAITRAQALLIIVGDPFVLATDDLWRKLICYCTDYHAYVGCELHDLDLKEAQVPVL